MLVGYARVSTAEQSLALQQDALKAAGCGRALSDAQVDMARVLLADPLRPIDEVCAALHVSRATLYRYVPTGSRPARAMPPERAARLRRGPAR